MKTKVFFTILSVVLHFGANGQSTGWSVSGNDIYNPNSGNVGIGTSAPTGKLEIIGPGTSSDNILSLKNDNNSSFIRVYGTGNSAFTLSGFLGLRSRGTIASPISLQANDRVVAFGANGYINSDYRGLATMEMFVGNTPGTNSYPGYIVFYTTPNNGTSRLERMRIFESGSVGIGTSIDPSPSFLLDVNGDIQAISVSQTSDERFKQDIKKITGSLDKISQIAGYSYFFNTDKFKDKNFPSGTNGSVGSRNTKNISQFSDGRR